MRIEESEDEEDLQFVLSKRGQSTSVEIYERLEDIGPDHVEQDTEDGIRKPKNVMQRKKV